MKNFAKLFAGLAPKIKADLAVLNHKLSSVPENVPETAFLCVTYECQLECAHCHYRNILNGRKTVMPADLAKKALDFMAGEKIPRVVFFGGEPLLYPFLGEISEYAVRKGLFAELDTNGILLTPEKAESLMRSGISAVRISLHSPSRKEHENIQGKGSFAAVEKAVKISLSTGFLTYLSSCLFSESPEKMRGIEKLAREWGVHGIRMLEYVGSPKRNFLPRPPRNSYIRTCFTGNPKKCLAQLGKLIFVDINGRVKPCPYAKHYSGGIRKKDAVTPAPGEDGKYPCKA